MIDYVFKSYVISSGFTELEREASKKRNTLKGIDEYIDLTFKMRNWGRAAEWDEARKINRASYSRRRRVQERIRTLLSEPCAFLTLTFNDDTLNRTNDKQRRDKVQRYLKSQNVPYVANIDFGAENHREHYHAVVQSQNVDLSAWRKYGNVNIKKIIIKKNVSIKLSKYIAKLTNHAIKETTHRQALIYSRMK